MDTTAQPQKICTICGLDCSTKQRVKDAQGRYVCSECLQRAKGAQAAKQDAMQDGSKPAPGAKPVPKAASEANDNAFILDIVEEPKVREGQKPCPSCGKGVNEGQVVCTSCGLNFKTGQRAIVNVLKPVELKSKTERNRSGGGGMGINIPEWVFGVVPCLAVMGLLAAAYETQDQTLLLVGVVIALVFGVATFVTGIVTAFREGDSTAGIIMLCSPLCGFLGFYTLYWVYVKCDSGVLKWMYGAAILNTIALQVVRFTAPEFFNFA